MSSNFAYDRMLFALAAFGQPSYNTETKRCQKKRQKCVTL